tara:strand:- start:150 stop:443 length:294 start_codon:yes stop_codon:yes gene_type:complete
MQTYVVSWSFSNSEDHLFASREFCDLFDKGEICSCSDGFELISCYHMPQDGTGLIICKADNLKNLYKLLQPWRENYNLIFNCKPALTNEEISEINQQ